MSDDLAAAARRALEAAVTAGAAEAEAWADEGLRTTVRVYEGAVESLSDAGSRGVGVRAIDGGRAGYAYGSDLTDAGLAQLGRAAATAAAVADRDEHAGLPDECGAAQLDGLHSPGLARWSTERKLDLALEAERTARRSPGVTQVETTVYSDSRARVALANTRGFEGAYEATHAWAYVSAFAGEGADLMTGLGVGVGRGPDDLDPEGIGTEAAQRAAELVGARQPATRRCPVLLDSFVAASFIGIVGGMLSADAVQRRRSPFAGQEGEEIASPALSLVDDALDPEGPGSAPFDAEGSPSRRTALLDGGRLRTFLFDARTARKAARATTANAVRGSYRQPPAVGPRNLVIAPGSADLPELARAAGEGLYVTSVAGLHSGVNAVSGTFSVGASGRLIEGGELGAPVREVTVAGDLRTMLRSVRQVGAEARWVPFGGNVKTGPLLLAEMTVSGA